MRRVRDLVSNQPLPRSPHSFIYWATLLGRYCEPGAAEGPGRHSGQWSSPRLTRLRWPEVLVGMRGSAREV